MRKKMALLASMMALTVAPLAAGPATAAPPQHMHPTPVGWL